MINKLRRFFLQSQQSVQQELQHSEKQLLSLGKLLSSTISTKKFNSLQDSEFKIFSQWGDDGIIQYLIKNIEIREKKFIEFGVENYRESNTRFLLMNNNWEGLVLDSSKQNIEQIQKSNFYWKYDLSAQQCFITKKNINQVIRTNNFHGNIGILSIDIDGNDYYIWDTINCVNADIVIIEYNSLFECARPITIPYQEDFFRTTAHHSNLYYGASLQSLCDLGQNKGYSFVGSNSAGNNAYFVKSNKMNSILPLSCEEGYVKAKFRESRDENGNLNFLNFEKRMKEISNMDVYNTRTKSIEKF
jgi:hypothetical protein